MQPCRRQFEYLVLLFLAVPISHNGHAADWTNEATISAGGFYTDNVCLSKDDKEGKWIATATPSLKVGRTGGKANMELLAELEFNSIANSSTDCNNSPFGSDKESPAPRLRFIGDTAIVEDWLYFDATAFADQNRVDAFGVGGGDNLNGTGNSNTTYRYSLSPYISRRIGESSDFSLRYTYDEEFNSEDIVGDSTSDAFLFETNTSPGSGRYTFGILADYSNVDYGARFNQPAFESELSSARLRTSAQINTQWQVNGYIGEEWNDYPSNSDTIDGTFWDVGVHWAPNERISVELGIGDRFFGAAPRFDISYRHKRSEIRTSYVRELTYNRDLRTTDTFGTPTPGDPLGLSGESSTLSNSPILAERFILAYQFTARRTSFSLNATHSDQEEEGTLGRDNTFASVSAKFERSLSRNFSSFLRLSWNKREQTDREVELFPRDSDTWRAAIGFDQNLGPNTVIRMDYQYSTRSSDNDIEEYDENRISASIRHTF